MDGPSMYDDEVIADSEDEGNELILPVLSFKGPTLLQDTMLADATQGTFETGFSSAAAKGLPISRINATTATFDPVLQPRPKPRPLKKTDLDNISSPIHASTRQATKFFSDIQMDIDPGMSNIADRAKTRSRNAKPQAGPQSIVPAPEIIELTSDSDDDFINHPPKPKSQRRAPSQIKASAGGKVKSNANKGVKLSEPKPRPRPRPIGRSKQAQASDTNSPLARISKDLNPMRTSSISDDPSPIPFENFLSQLPPSDPPTSTSASCDYPPIETLRQHDTDMELPSSPSSLFSEYSNGKRKRKRNTFNIDELDSDPDPLAESAFDNDTQLMPPPLLTGSPAFFAGSSSVGGGTVVPSRKKTPKTKKQRKKVSETEDVANNPKAKSKQKKPVTNKVEVVIERPKEKAKGKGKAKEVFKSREFIDDDDEGDAMDMIAVAKSTVSKKPESLTSLNSFPNSNMEDANKAWLNMGLGSSHIDKSMSSEGAEDKPGKHAVSRSKRNRQIVSDEEGEETPESSEVVVDEIPATAKANGKGKSREYPAKARTNTKPVLQDDINVDVDLRNKCQSSNREEEEYCLPGIKENIRPVPKPTLHASPTPVIQTATPASSISSRYTIAPKTKPTPMSDLIRRVNSKPGSPFCSPAPHTGTPSKLGTAYSPYVKASRSALSRIAPLHPNRRTPPPPLPPPPPKKKSKKELEREEQWEEELIESVGGVTEWACMTDTERKEMRRAKREKEMFGWED